MLLAFFLILVFVPLLIGFCLPQSFWRSVSMNCRRLDGSISDKRFEREFSAIGQFLATISVPAFLSFTSLFVVLSLFFTFVIPVDLLSRSIAAFDVDPGVWKEGLTDVQAEHRRFMEDRGASNHEILETQQFLWHGSPGIVCGFLFVCLGIVMAFLHCVREGVNDLARGIRQRREAYARIDVSRMRRARQAGQVSTQGTSLATP